MAILSAFRRLSSIRSINPELTSENWFEVQPCLKIKLGSEEIILTQPTSTFFVYSLGILTLCVGIYFSRITGGRSIPFLGVLLYRCGESALSWPGPATKPSDIRLNVQVGKVAPGPVGGR